jgi:hypothetical protein
MKVVQEKNISGGSNPSLSEADYAEHIFRAEYDSVCSRIPITPPIQVLLECLSTPSSSALVNI